MRVCSPDDRIQPDEGAGWLESTVRDLRSWAHRYSPSRALLLGPLPAQHLSLLDHRDQGRIPLFGG